MFHGVVLLTIILLCVECLPLSPADETSKQKTNFCPDVFDRYPNAHCIVYDDERCDEKDWVITLTNGTRLSFGSNFKLSNDVESVSVRQGCTLRTFKEWHFAGEKFDFMANGTDLHETLDEKIQTEGFDDAINSMKCFCE